MKSCGALNVELYTGVDERLDAPRILPPILHVDDIGGLRVLIADDVADTGTTLAMVQEMLAAHVLEARTAVLYQKPRSVIVADHSWKVTDRWIEFPWSSTPL